MVEALRGPGGRSILVVLTMVAITLATLDALGFEGTDRARSVVRSVVGPIRSGGDVVFEPLDDVWEGVRTHDELEQENDRLRRQVQVLAERAAEQESDSAALADLMAEVGLADTGDIDSVIARLTAPSFTNLERNVELDRGAADGIEPGMTVVAEGGLVGRITEVTPNRAIVEPLTNVDFAVGVRFIRARDVVLARGQGADSALLVDEAIELESDLRAGDLAETSGLDRSPFPPAIPVGEVTDLTTEDQQTVGARIEPFVDLDRLSVVRVLLWEAPA